ncbi:uncharacterized protein LOC112521474 [Cynara cardunculus var. scolymus]|uniref:Zinc finger, RING/FYVE/PHD-type n=1 Tax=Cynara cardunculus var. scolymus TaxID=59895 RepID=A0A124SBI7_CYNCS|nr:uncharacterized protein LOC112521474 [Cynara cardunculus var. scolymus]XP_024986127.1 uncharacterized protein LOC112521474 [Cynara cardunculus var. scolymus]KVH90745.1 hypothetical protein Ccrd_007257 [Cynara cardunculus var. scolymus]
MAIAGINNVSVLDSSYLGENYSPVSRRWGNQERPISRTSFIRKMWRDLEGESRFRDNERQQTSGMGYGSIGSLCSCSSGGAEGEDLSVNTSEVENECPRDQNQMGLQNGQEDDGNMCLQRLPAFGVAEKQRVRQVFREWGSKNCSGRALNVSHKNNCSRAQWLCEYECKRVRTVRQWIELNTQQAETGHSGAEEQGTEIGCQIEQGRDGLGVNHTRVGARRSICRLYGRQALLDLLTRFERERKRELRSLLENRPVTNFAHRNRLQSLLRGRFLWNQRFVQDKKCTSIAASELGLLRQTHTVSDLRKGFLSRLDNYGPMPDGSQSDTSSNNDMKYHQENFQELPDDIADEFESPNMRSDISGTHKVDWEADTCGSSREYSAPAEERHEQGLEDEGRQQQPSTEFIGIGDIDQDQDQEGLVERSQGVCHIELSQRALELECTTRGLFQSNWEEPEVREASEHHDPSETNTDSLSWHGSAEEWQEPLTEDNGIEWHHLTNTESDGGLDADSIEHEHEWYQETAVSDFQESHNVWYDNTDTVEDTTESWFAPQVVRRDAFYTSDDDNNGNRLELRELMSRRRVSNLLQSDFRVRLDQLIQSYVERQDQASESDDEWMLEREQQDQDQQSVHGNDDATEAVEGPEGAHSSAPATSQTHQDDTEWEMINGLCIDMARLQERMNNMQTMVETCMNVQLELQRSVQQEVSAALNRSSTSEDDRLQTDESKWKAGKEEACPLCCDSSFDSSPTRCGPVYICSKCAVKINWSKLKESVRHP